MSQPPSNKADLLSDQQQPNTQLPEDKSSGSHPSPQPDSATDNETDEHLLLEIIRVRSQQKQKKAQLLWKLANEELQEFFMNYQMFDGLGVTMKELLLSKSLKLVKNDNRVFFGEIKDQRKHGVGIAIYQDGRIYEGQFANNQKNGFGYEVYPNCNVYVGDFEKNKKHGRGSFYWFTLSSVAPSNHEEIEYYRGEWWGGLPSGRGVHKQANGDICQGTFKNGLKHGQGLQQFSNGDSYKGQYINGLPEGYGQYIWADGSNYKGDFKQGVRNGFGIWKKNNSQNCESYRGHYLLDRKTGYGVYIWQNGDYYKGEFFQDTRHGYGQFYSNSTLVYKGAWQNGKQAPHIKLTKRKNHLLQGQFRNNVSIMDLSQGDIHLSHDKSQSKSLNPRYFSRNRSNIDVVKLEQTLKKKPKLSPFPGTPSNPELQKSETKKGRVGHRNCIPVQHFGMPRLYK